MNSIKPVWIELGLQTMHKKSADYIRRGYNLAVYDNAVKVLKNSGIYVITHQILFLPGETLEDMVKTTEHIAFAGTDGIKFHLLHILKGTDIEADYISGKINLPELEEYISALEECIRHLPANIAIHRLTGDGAKSKLIAPLWTANKKHVLNSIKKRFNADDLQQGSKLIKIKGIAD